MSISSAGWYRSPSLVGAVDDDPTRRTIADGLIRMAIEAHLPAPTRHGRLDRLAALDELVRRRQVGAQAVELFLDVGLCGEQESFLMQPLWV